MRTSISHSITLKNVAIKNKAVLAFLAVWFGIYLPRIFHFFNLGHVFLPMFLPITVVSLSLPLPYIIIVSSITPLLSNLLYGMPLLNTAIIMCGQLIIVGTSQRLLLHTRISRYAIVPISIFIERFLTLGVSILLPSLSISTKAVLMSYPGIIILTIVGLTTVRAFYID